MAAAPAGGAGSLLQWCCPGRRRRERRGGVEERALGRARLDDVGLVEGLDAGVHVADAAGHGFRPEELDGQGEEGEEEVHDVRLLASAYSTRWLLVSTSSFMACVVVGFALGLSLVGAIPLSGFRI